MITIFACARCAHPFLTPSEAEACESLHSLSLGALSEETAVDLLRRGLQHVPALPAKGLPLRTTPGLREGVAAALAAQSAPPSVGEAFSDPNRAPSWPIEGA